jgi:hypothetical protein
MLACDVSEMIYVTSHKRLQWADPMWLQAGKMSHTAVKLITFTLCDEVPESSSAIFCSKSHINDRS